MPFFFPLFNSIDHLIMFKPSSLSKLTIVNKVLTQLGIHKVQLESDGNINDNDNSEMFERVNRGLEKIRSGKKIKGGKNGIEKVAKQLEELDQTIEEVKKIPIVRFSKLSRYGILSSFFIEVFGRLVLKHAK